MNKYKLLAAFKQQLKSNKNIDTFLMDCEENIDPTKTACKLIKRSLIYSDIDLFKKTINYYAKFNSIMYF
jgi:hypothetical protein